MPEFRELEPKRTPLTYREAVNALLLAWECVSERPSRAAVKLAAAQIAIETGMQSCMNFNISGIKSRPDNGRSHWQYFATTENLSAPQLEEAKRVNPVAAPPVMILGPVPGHPELTKIKVFPKHPYCCFRAFESLDEAMVDHLLTLKKTFPHGLEGLITGVPELFARGLKRDRYYTALESEYAAGLKWRLKELGGKLKDSDTVWGEVP